MENKVLDKIKESLSPEEYNRLKARMKDFEDKLDPYDYLDSLVSIGYLSPDEAKSLREPLQELPRGKKLLIACYVQYSKAIDYNKAINGDLLTKVQEAVGKRDISAMAEGNKSLTEVLGFEEAKNLLNEWIDALVGSVKDIVSNFVCEKRRRIRAELKKALLLRMANALSFEVEQSEETGEPLDSIPYLRAMAKENGYRENAKSLNDEDRKALSLCADYYLDLLEVLHLNGVEEARVEEYKSLYDEEERLKEDFYYRDQADEALLEFADIAYMQSKLYDVALLGDLRLKGASVNYMNLCKVINSEYLTPEDLVVGRVLNTKFREYAIALYEDEQLKAKLSPENLKKWDKFLKSVKDKAPAKVKKASATKEPSAKKRTTTTKRTKSK